MRQLLLQAAALLIFCWVISACCLPKKKAPRPEGASWQEDAETCQAFLATQAFPALESCVDRIKDDGLKLKICDDEVARLLKEKEKPK